MGSVLEGFSRFYIRSADHQLILIRIRLWFRVVLPSRVRQPLLGKVRNLALDAVWTNCGSYSQCCGFRPGVRDALLLSVQEWALLFQKQRRKTPYLEHEARSVPT